MDKILKSINKITILGEIKGENDFEKIKDTILDYNLKENDQFTIDINDSISLPSCMIRYIKDLAAKKKIKLTLHIKDERLINLLNELGLSKLLKIEPKALAQ